VFSTNTKFPITNNSTSCFTDVCLMLNIPWIYMSLFHLMTHNYYALCFLHVVLVSALYNSGGLLIFPLYFIVFSRMSLLFLMVNRYI